MTRIDFYFNVRDKSQLIFNLAQTASQKKRQVLIYANNEAAASEISDYLWQQNPSSFLPNVSAHHPHAAKTRMVIGSQADADVLEVLNQDDLLINVSENQANFFSRFTQLIELVGLDETEKTQARSRYKFYRDCGYEITNHDYDKHEYAKI
jgi:DNA polymerase III subunit chi